MSFSFSMMAIEMFLVNLRGPKIITKNCKGMKKTFKVKTLREGHKIWCETADARPMFVCDLLCALFFYTFK